MMLFFSGKYEIVEHLRSFWQLPYGKSASVTVKATGKHTLFSPLDPYPSIMSVPGEEGKMLLSSETAGTKISLLT